MNKFTKTVVLMVGIPGAGKSTYVDTYVDRRAEDQAWVVSADYYFYQDGRYAFDPSKLGAAHGSCLRSFIEGLDSGAPTVIVDNTNTSVLELAPYVAVAQAFNDDDLDVIIEIVHVVCDVETAYKRCLHGVPRHAIERMANNIDRMVREIPPYWNVSYHTVLE